MRGDGCVFCFVCLFLLGVLLLDVFVLNGRCVFVVAGLIQTPLSGLHKVLVNKFATPWVENAEYLFKKKVCIHLWSLMNPLDNPMKALENPIESLR